MRKETLTWETNSTLTYPGSDGKARRYKEEWNPLRLTLKQYQAVVAVKSHDVDFSIYDLPGEDWKPLTEEAREKYRSIRAAEIKPAKDAVVMKITGNAEIEDGQLTVGGVKGSPFREIGKNNEDYWKTFKKVHVTIAAGEEDGHDELRFFGDDEERESEVYFGAVISKDKMRQLMADIRLSKELLVIEINAKALVFEDEPSAWGGGNGDYFLPASPGFALAILTDATINWGKPISRLSEEENQKMDESMGIFTPERQRLRILQNIERGIWTLVTVVVIVATSFYFRR